MKQVAEFLLTFDAFRKALNSLGWVYDPKAEPLGGGGPPPIK